MLLKKENKFLFKTQQSVEKNDRRTSSSAAKRALIRISSSSRLPKDFFKPSELTNCIDRQKT